MLQWRLAVSATLIPILIALFWCDQRVGASAPVLLLIAQLISAGCIRELVILLRLRFEELKTWPLMVGSGLVVLSAWWAPLMSTNQPIALPDLDPLAFCVCTLSVVWTAFLAHAVITYREGAQNTQTLAAISFSLLYVGVGLCLAANLRWVAGVDRGYFVLGSLIITVKMGDVGAYTIGRLFGRRKFIPRLSPGKTWAGVYGAIFASVIASSLWLGYAAPLLIGESTGEIRWGRVIVYGLVMGIAGIIGDLVESLVKRDAGVKDSGNTIPGFGGVLDLMDSLLFAGPCAYFIWRYFPPLG